MNASKTYLLILFLFTTGIAMQGCNDSPNSVLNKSGTPLDGWVNELETMESETLSESELEGLLFMVEEEKLARDVYIYFDSMYQQKVFNNIIESERNHVAAMRYLLDRYNISDPTVDNLEGEFENEELQTLYNQLTEQGSVSVTEALKTGALIEETDLVDITKEIEETDNDDITFVYQNLKNGSINHLKAFVRNLSKYGITYQPQVLEENEYYQYLN
ncbi:MAG: DUF2202 domain-containing protein [Bacteroidota bacterium]